jgi:hypothetical protein
LTDDDLEKLEAALAAREAAPSPPPEPGDVAAIPTQAPNLVAQAFTALLALEEGEPGARPVRLTTSDGELRLTDQLVDEVTRRIIERLAPNLVRDVVVQVVSEVTERLVREEIERIRNK